MVDNKDKNGAPDDFEDDFDVEDFSESDFDEAAFDDSEISDLPEEDFGDEDFADNDWQEDNAANNKLLTSGEKKGISFNTMVMIGAFVVGGGVLALNVMSKSKEQAEQGTGSVFQSMLNISGVMDGDLFGSKETEQTPEQLAAQAEQTQNEGFLNNPGAIIPSDTASNPPQPTPIAPPDETEEIFNPLVPMPEDAMPRGPEEGTPESQVAISETPIEQPAPSAEDILKKAMANREQKTAEANEETAEPALPVQPLPEEEPQMAETSEAPVDAEPAKQEEPAPAVAEIDEPAPEEPAPVVAETAPVADVPVPAATPAPSSEAVAQNTQALETLDGRLQDVLKRMDQIETDLGSVKTGKQADTDSLQETIETLKAEIAELKRRPAAAPVSAPKVAKEEPAVDEVAEEPAPKKAAPKKVAKATKPAPKAAPTASTGRWELRAAQPGRAWVSKPGERDMQSVEVGQTISGIGRVTSILYQNGRWTVQGTQGQINQ